MTKPRILLVEDEFLIRITLAEALADQDYDVVEAGDAEEALAALSREAPIDLMLTDIQLPNGMDGKMLAVRMREVSPALPVIFMSGRPAPLPDSGGAPQMLIAKPYLPSEVCAAVRRLLQPQG